MLEINKRKIKCPIFSIREKIIQKLNYDLWRQDLTLDEIKQRAHSLLVETDLLSNCQKYNKKSFKCKICRAISNLRKKRAAYILGSTQKLIAVQFTSKRSKIL